MTPLANAYASGAHSGLVLNSSPGRWVRFRSGYAPLLSVPDVIAALRHPAVIIEIDEEHADWLADWAAKAGKDTIKATLKVPAGFSVNSEYKAYRVAEPSWDEGEDDERLIKRGRGRPRKDI